MAFTQRATILSGGSEGPAGGLPMPRWALHTMPTPLESPPRSVRRASVKEAFHPSRRTACSTSALAPGATP
eukprot:518921-Pyramimonas_sp.AAC.1